MKQAQDFLTRFRQAQTVAEKEAITVEYKAFFNGLEPAQQQQATAVMQALWPSIQQKVDELDELMTQAKERLQVSAH